MKNELWQKACAALLMLILSLAGWGLWKVNEVNERTIRIETKMEIWHTDIGGDNTAMMVAAPPQQQLQFAQRSMVRAFNQIMARDYSPALKTLRVGLEETGLHCRVDGDYLRCE